MRCRIQQLSWTAAFDDSNHPGHQNILGCITATMSMACFVKRAFCLLQRRFLATSWVCLWENLSQNGPKNPKLFVSMKSIHYTYHQSSIAAMSAYMQMAEQPDKAVDTLIDVERKRIAVRNRNELKSLSDIVLLCRKQGIALRGHTVYGKWMTTMLLKSATKVMS